MSTVSGPGKPVIATSTWSLHRTIGMSWWDRPDRPATPEATWGEGKLRMLELPGALAAHGYRQFHLCHFHLERRDRVWLAEFRDAAKSAGVAISMLLIDDGDISHPEHGQRDADWVRGWIDTGAELGAQSARVIAGKQEPGPEALARSTHHLSALTGHGTRLGVQIYTENWFALTPGPEQIDHLLNTVGEDLHLLADFGNWEGASKYDDLAHILHRASDIHAKAGFSDVGMDETDYGLCLDACRKAGYGGPFTLIYDGSNADEWAGLSIERDFIVGYWANTARG